MRFNFFKMINLIMIIHIFIACQRNWHSWQAPKTGDQQAYLLLDDTYVANALFATAVFDQIKAGRLLLSTTEKKHYLSPHFAKEVLGLDLQIQRNEMVFEVGQLRFDQFQLKNLVFLATADHLELSTQQTLDKLEPQIIGILSLPLLLDSGIALEIRLDDGKILFRETKRSIDQDLADIPLNAIRLGSSLSEINGKWVWETYEQKETKKETKKETNLQNQNLNDQSNPSQSIKIQETKTIFQISSSHASNRWPTSISSEVINAQILFLDHQDQAFELNRLYFTKKQAQSSTQSEIGLYHFWGGRLYLNQRGVFFWKDPQADLLKPALNRFKPYFECDETCRTQSKGLISLSKETQDEILVEIPKRHQLAQGLWLKYQINPIGLPIHIYIAYELNEQQRDQRLGEFFKSAIKTPFAKMIIENHQKKSSAKDDQYEIELVDIVRLNRPCLGGICLILNAYD